MHKRKMPVSGCVRRRHSAAREMWEMLCVVPQIPHLRVRQNARNHFLLTRALYLLDTTSQTWKSDSAKPFAVPRDTVHALKAYHAALQWMSVGGDWVPPKGSSASLGRSVPHKGLRRMGV